MIAKTPKLSVTNCHVLKADNGYVLVDTGYGREWGAFSRQLEGAGIGPTDLRYLILTHHHDDHAGLVKQLVRENPRIRVVMSGLAERPLATGKND
jgi:glyoxylase-like metal-dependent hydrolase (beta-lactamase superfamily II)